MNSIEQMINVLAPMRDGVRLSHDIRMPRGDRPYPAVLQRTPYNKAISVTDQVMRRFVDAGFAHVTQDGRGTHESAGDYTPWRNDIDDGYDTVQWVAAQPWCDGRVVMTGASYCGWTQLAAAKTAPPALKAIAPTIIGADAYHDMIYPGGPPSLGLLWWCINNDGRSQRDELGENWSEHFKTLPLRDLDKAVGCPSPIMQSWLDHPMRDDFWTEMDTTDSEPTAAGAMMIGGWFDPFVGGAFRAYTRMAAMRQQHSGGPIHLLVGPWPHGVGGGPVLGDVDFGPTSVMDVDGEKLRFYRACLEGVPLDMPPVRVFMMGVNEWRNEQQWPPARARDVSYYLGCENYANSLHGDGTLSTKPIDGKLTDTYAYDPADPVPAIGGAAILPNVASGPYDQRPAERRDDVLCYSSEAMGERLEITGHVEVELHISSSAPDTDFVGRLCDVQPDGRSIVLCDGVLRTRYRDGFDREVMMTPGEVVTLRLEFGPIAHAFMPGHRIRLEVTSSCFPRFARNLNTGGDIATEQEPVIAEQTVHHSNQHRSRLILPVVS